MIIDTLSYIIEMRCGLHENTKSRISHITKGVFDLGSILIDLILANRRAL